MFMAAEPEANLMPLANLEFKAGHPVTAKQERKKS